MDDSKLGMIARLFESISIKIPSSYSEGLSFVQLQALVVISRMQPVVVSDVSKFLNVIPPQFSRHVLKLASLGLIQKTKSAENKKYHLLSLTEKGQEVVAENLHHKKQMAQYLLNQLDAKEGEQWTIIADKLNAALEKNMINKTH